MQGATAIVMAAREVSGGGKAEKLAEEIRILKKALME